MTMLRQRRATSSASSAATWTPASRRPNITVEGTWESARQWHTTARDDRLRREMGQRPRDDVVQHADAVSCPRPLFGRPRPAGEPGARSSRPRSAAASAAKSGDDNASVVCALLARKSGRPVELIHTREEEFLASHPRMPMRYWVRLGFHKDGRVMAKEIQMWADNGAYTGKSQAILGAASVRHDALYKYPCARGNSTLVYTNLVPTGAFRGFGNPSADWAVEQAWDVAAEKLHVDVLDLLRLNAVDPATVRRTTTRSRCELKQCMDKAASLIGWGRSAGKLEPAAPAQCVRSGTRSRVGHGLQRARQRPAQLRRLGRQHRDRARQRGRPRHGHHRRGRDRSGQSHGAATDRGGGAGTALRARGHHARPTPICIPTRWARSRAGSPTSRATR